MRNHYVPQFLQRTWTSPHDGSLEVYHLTASGVHCTRKVPKSAGFKNDMLSLSRDQVAGMDKHAIEKVVLQQIDNDAALVRAKLHNRQLSTLSHDERCAWVRFIMSLRLRDPSIVETLVVDSDKELRKSLTLNRFEYEQLAGDDDPANLESWTESHFPGLIENFGLSFYADLINDARIGNQLLHLQWWIFDVSSAPNRLLLGDRPSIFFGGIDHPDLVVVLPIAPDRLFIATRGDGLKAGLPQVSVKELTLRVNDATVRQAATYVYGQDAQSCRFIVNRRSFG